MVLSDENRHANSRNSENKKASIPQLPISPRFTGWNIEVIGKGSYGLVRLATSRYGEKVAIKTVRKEKSASVQACLSEHAVLQKIGKHKNVIELISGNLLPGNIVELALEFVPYDIFVLNPYLNYKHARHFFRQLVEGVDYIHSREIAHRDIKIENLLITKDFLLKITDFGLATASHKNGMQRRMTGFTGTKCYMPPEMYRQPYKLHPVDVYACGITLIEMINGRCPWDEPTEKDLKYRMWENGSIKHSVEWEEMPANAIPLLKWILHSDPKHRATFDDIRCDPWYKFGCASDSDWMNLRSALKEIDAVERKNRKKGRFRGDDISMPLQIEKVTREKSYHAERSVNNNNNRSKEERANGENEEQQSPRSPRIHKPFWASEQKPVVNAGKPASDGGISCSLM